MSDYIVSSTDTTYTLFVSIYLFEGEKPDLSNRNIYYRITDLFDEKLYTSFFEYDVDDLKKVLSFNHTTFTLYRDNGIMIDVSFEIVAVGNEDFVVKMQCVKRGVKNVSKKH